MRICLRRAAAVAAALFILIAATLPSFAYYEPAELPIDTKYYSNGELISTTTTNIRFRNWRTSGVADVEFHVPAVKKISGKNYVLRSVMAWNAYDNREVSIGVVPETAGTDWIWQAQSVSADHSGNAMQWWVSLAYYNGSISSYDSYLTLYVEYEEASIDDVISILNGNSPMPDGYSETLAEVARQNTVTNRVIGDAAALDPTATEKQAALDAARAATVGSLSEGDVSVISQIAGAAFLQDTPFYGIILLFLVAIVAGLILKGAKGS